MSLTKKNFYKIFAKQGITLPCFFYGSVDSTNTRAKELTKKGLDGGAVIAARQTKGRGRYDRSFLSKRGKGVYLSFVGQARENFAALSALSALAVLGAVKQIYDIECKIKWPNDVIYQGKKLCGILPESVAAGDTRYVIVGVGVNVNYTEVDFGALAGKAVSIRQITGKNSCVLTLAAQLVKNLQTVFSRFDGEEQILIEEFRASCDTIGKTIVFERGGATVTGKAVGIDESCALLVEREGRTEKIAWGEISVRPAG